jgi:hypothetical protein
MWAVCGRTGETSADAVHGPGSIRAMPDPTLFIWGLIAVAVVLLWPIRNWIRSRYDRDDRGDDDDRDDDSGG